MLSPKHIKTILFLLNPKNGPSFWTKKKHKCNFFQRVVIIVRGELPAEEEMEEDLKKYIRMNTYIESENPWFWQRLR